MEEAKLIYLQPLTAQIRQYNKNTKPLFSPSEVYRVIKHTPSSQHSLQVGGQSRRLLCVGMTWITRTQLHDGMSCTSPSLHFITQASHAADSHVFQLTTWNKNTKKHKLPSAVSGTTNATRRQLSVERVMTICRAFHVNTALQFPRWEQNKELCCTERMSGLLKSFSKRAGVSERSSKVATRPFFF